MGPLLVVVWHLLVGVLTVGWTGRSNMGRGSARQESIVIKGYGKLYEARVGVLW